jgi:hypothetical protein
MKFAFNRAARRSKFSFRTFAPFLFTLFASGLARAQTAIPTPAPCTLQQGLAPSQSVASVYISALVTVIRQSSFPQLASTDVAVKTFRSNTDYFQTRFSFSRFFLLRRMRYFVEVNPNLFDRQVPASGVCAILAHELAHVVTLSHGNRIRRLGLVRLLSKGFSRKFERRTDLEAIHLGYGDGLKTYRAWVYGHIPPQSLAEKRKRYFSPEEITSLQEGLNRTPKLLAYWRKRIPLSQVEIARSPGYPY